MSKVKLDTSHPLSIQGQVYAWKTQATRTPCGVGGEGGGGEGRGVGEGGGQEGQLERGPGLGDCKDLKGAG